MRPRSALLAATCLLGLASLAAAAQELVCDGKLHNITMPSAPYPAGVPWAPITNQPDFTCTRARRSSGLQCGGARRFSCGAHVFEPVTFGSGSTPGIISPSNPVIFSLVDGSAKAFSFLQWTAVDVGTAGARLEGVYAPDSGLDNVVTTHEWVPNGAISLPDGKKLFGPCTNCELDAGIKVLSVSALPGTGFRGMELSQKYVDTRCEGSGVNDDGIYWAGMTYACVQVRAAWECAHSCRRRRSPWQQPLLLLSSCMPTAAAHLRRHGPGQAWAAALQWLHGQLGLQSQRGRRDDHLAAHVLHLGALRAA